MTPTPDTQFPCAMVSGVPVVVTPEEIDMTNADGLRAALLESPEHGHGRLLVDMSRTQFCDTAGLHALVDAHKRALAQGREMRVVISGAVIQRIFALTGLDQAIPTFTSVQEALLLTRELDGGRMSVAGSALPGIEAERVRRWLAEHVDGLVGTVEFGLVSGGRSNLTYRLTDAAGASYALRRPPTGGVLSTAHDVSREWRFISALAPTAVPVPRPVAYCADSAITGAEFYVMGFVEGLVLADSDAGLAMAPQARAGAAEDLIDVLVALHALDPVAVGLGDMVRKTGYLERQLRRWQAQVHATDPPELALLDEVHDLLARRIPAQASGIVHGDYRAGNVAFGPDGAVRAVFDWELATSGDPMADLGWLAATWQDPGEPLPPATPGPSTVPGFPARAQLVRRYARLSGRDVSNLPYWVAFARWRSACIGVGVRSRYLAGHMADDGYATTLLPGAAVDRTVLAEAARDALRDGV